jgi:hypothetical protein
MKPACWSERGQIDAWGLLHAESASGLVIVVSFQVSYLINMINNREEEARG